jgi:hypothetical protein
MSDTYAANDLRPADAVGAAGLSLTEQAPGAPLAEAGVAGFDVNAAAAEVWSTSSPGAFGAPAQRWSAADYGWDPADPNAVAWADYYSEQGLDPAAVAAQQAAEAAPAAAPAAGLEAAPTPVPEPELGDEQLEALAPLDLAAPLPAPEPQPELDEQALLPPEPMAELDFAPVAELDLAAPEETPLAPHEVPASDFEVAASSMWDLLPAPEAAQPAAEQQAQLPGGWPGNDASGHLDEFHFAGGGSFDEATAPIGDLSPEGLVEAYPPGVDLTPDPDAFEAPPGPDELPPLDLAGMGPEAAAELPVSLEPEVSIDLGFVEDDLAPASPWAPAAAAPAAQPAERPPAPEMDWAAELAVPAGDGAIDLASFEAAPEEQPAAREGTAMWGLAGSPGTAQVAAQTFAAPPLQDDPWDAPAAAQAAPLAPLELAPADGPGPFDLGEPDPAAEPLPLATLDPAGVEPEVLVTTDEEILEVGAEVIEIAPADEPAAAEVAVPAAVAPVVAAPPEPAPAPFLAPVAPVPAAAEPAPAPVSSYVAGPHRVVIHTADGQVKRGTLCDVALDGPELLLQPQAGGIAEALPAERIKAIFFMLATGDAPPAPEGKKVRVTFRDGRQVAGFSPDYQPERAGFFMIPVDTRTHTARIWVYRTAVRQVTIS